MAYIDKYGVEYSDDKTKLIGVIKSDDFSGDYIVPDGVTIIGAHAFRECYRLVSVQLPDSVVEIGDGAFCNCSKLSTINLPKNLKKIGEDAFESCNSLTTIDIPKDIEKIGHGAFYFCEHLDRIIVRSDYLVNNLNSFFIGDFIKEIVIDDNVTYVRSNAFSFFDRLRNLTIGRGVYTIGEDLFPLYSSVAQVSILSDHLASNPYMLEQAFRNNVSSIIFDGDVTEVGGFRQSEWLNSIIMGNSVKRIRSNAFEVCTGLYRVVINSDNIEIGADAFMECESLKEVVIQSKKIEICARAFAFCSKLKSVVFDCSILKNEIVESDCELIIHDEAFIDCTELEYISLPQCSIKFGTSIFSGCKRLTSIELPNNIKKIGNDSFRRCTNKTSIEVPNGLTEIGDYTFSGCKGLTHIEIPNNVTKIGDHAFSGCIGLKSIEIPNSVVEIESSAFYDCTALASIEIPNSVNKIGSFAFRRCTSLTSIDIPNSVIEVKDGAFVECTGLVSPIYHNKKLIFVPQTYKGTFVVDDGTTEITSCAFIGCANLTSIRIPNSIKVIDSDFEDCKKLQELHISKEYPEDIGFAEDDIIEDAVAANCTLYVPIGTGYAYRHHPVFGKFKEVVIEKYANSITTESEHVENAISTNKQKESSISDVVQSVVMSQVVSQSSVRTMVFFDTETTGVPRDYQAPVSDSANWPRLVQLAWIVWDSTNNKQLKEKSVIISPDGFVIPSEASSVHGITTERARREGINLHSALDEFMTDVQNASCVIGHNVDFDRHIVGAELYRMGKNTGILIDLPFTCTMQSSIEFCQLPPYRYGHYKWPKLDELHQKLFGHSFADAHDAMADIRATKDCYFELVKRGLIKES